MQKAKSHDANIAMDLPPMDETLRFAAGERERTSRERH